MKHEKILIVESDPEFRWSLDKILTKTGYDVSFADDAPQAIAILSKNGYPLILFDLNTPERLSLLREIKHNAPNSKMIVLSVDNNSETSNQALRLGAFALLNKPIKKRKLLESVRSAF